MDLRRCQELHLALRFGREHLPLARRTRQEAGVDGAPHDLVEHLADLADRCWRVRAGVGEVGDEAANVEWRDRRERQVAEERHEVGAHDPEIASERRVPQ